MSLSDKLIADSIFLYLDFCTPFLPSSKTKACRGIGELFSIIEHGLWSDEARLSGLLPFFLKVNQQWTCTRLLFWYKVQLYIDLR
jgi:hypothetical protein